MKKFYFITTTKPWETDIDNEIECGNKFVDNRLHKAFYVDDSVPDDATLLSVSDDPYSFYNDDYFIIAPIIKGNVYKKYAVFLRKIGPWSK
jgi:hypothetical protein